MPHKLRRSGARAVAIAAAALATGTIVASADAAKLADYSRKSSWSVNWASPSERIAEHPRSASPGGGAPDTSLPYEMRVEMRDGDPEMPFDQTANGERHELQTGTVWTSGQTRWVGWWEYIETWPSVNRDWQIIFQAKTPNTTSPGIDVQVWADTLRVVTPWASTNTPISTPIQRGRWYHVALGFNQSTDPSKGWVELWLDGKQIGSRYTGKTAPAEGGVYMKTGIYRADSINGQVVRRFAGMSIYDSRPAPGAEPAPAPGPTPAPPPATGSVPPLGQTLPAGNLVQNPRFASGLANWATWQATAAVVPASDGSSVARVTRTAGTTFTLDDVTPAVPAATAGRTYKGVAWVRAADTASVGATARLRVRETGRQDVAGTPVTLTSAWQAAQVSLVAQGANALDVRVEGGGGSTAAMNVGGVALTTDGAPAAPPPLLSDGFEGAAPGAGGSPWTVLRDAGNTVGVVTSPVRSGAKALRTVAAARGGARAAVRATVGGRADLAVAASVNVGASTLPAGRSRVLLRTSATAGGATRYDAGLYRTADGVLHWAVWGVSRTGAKIAPAVSTAVPALGRYTTLRLYTGWDRKGARATLVADGEILTTAGADMSGVRGAVAEVGNVWSQAGDAGTVTVDDVAVSTEVAPSQSFARSKARRATARLAVLRAPRVLRAGARSHLRLRSAVRGRAVVRITRGRAVVSRRGLVVRRGTTVIGLAAPATAGRYVVRISVRGREVATPLTVSPVVRGRAKGS